MATAIEFENVSKQYRLGLVSTGTLRHDINRWWQTSILGKEDPYLKIGETNDRSTKGNSEYVWALKDINFKVEQGDVVGIIGKNGAGKSTLLKLLSRVTGPTTGVIRAHGRIGSLLEVGTGFHGEMTGRENIFMNGAILGMTRQEIQAKLDEIIDFSGCERYIDTPVKRYSSGMTVRLGFAVAAFLDPEILVVDEVLAVGDAEFQKKAIGKMQEVSQGEGRTVLFVSHNMTSVKNLCNHGVLLEKGYVRMMGDIEECIVHYLKDNINALQPKMSTNPYAERSDQGRYKNEVYLEEAILLNDDIANIANDEPIEIEISILKCKPSIDKTQVCVSFENGEGNRVSYLVSKPISLDSERTRVKLNVTRHNLPKGEYNVRIELGIRDFTLGGYCFNYDAVDHAISFNVKYMHAAKKDEFISWNYAWGTIYQEDGSLIVEKL